MNVLLEDSSSHKVPKLLEENIRSLSENESFDLSQEDIFFLLIVILMVENEFIPILSNGVEWDRHKPIDKYELSFWKTTGSYEVVFFMSGFKEIPLRLILCPLGKVMSVNLIINYDKTDVYSLFLPLNKYVVSTKVSTIPMIFNDMKHLSHIYKNKITVPAKSTILNFYGCPSASLIGLPAEVFLYLLMNLPVIDIINMAKTCKRISSIIETDNFWHKLFNRDFKVNNVNVEISWKSQYIKKYKEKQEKKIQACRSTGSLRAMLQYSPYRRHNNNTHLWELLFD